MVVAFKILVNMCIVMTNEVGFNVFISSEGCPETYTGLYWYCWYDVFTGEPYLTKT